MNLQNQRMSLPFLACWSSIFSENPSPITIILQKTLLQAQCNGAGQSFEVHLPRCFLLTDSPKTVTKMALKH